MEKIKRQIINNQDKLKYVILGCAGLAAFNCLTRPDFNLYIYIYFFYVTYIMTENKVRIIFN